MWTKVYASDQSHPLESGGIMGWMNLSIVIQNLVDVLWKFRVMVVVESW
jgi:hypothetical protein